MASLDITSCPATDDTWEISSISGAASIIASNDSTEACSEHGSSDDEREQRTSPADDAVLAGKSFEETLTIFDWDDTLMPTSDLERHGLLSKRRAVVGKDVQVALQVLADKIVETLQEAMKFGKVIIITNAAEGWVQESCRHFLPSVEAYLSYIPVVSARSTFEPTGIRSPTEWKSLAFQREVGAFCDGLAKGQHGNIVSVGDSVHEHLALISAACGRPGCLSKSLGLAERPSIEQLSQELDLVAGSFEEVALFEEDLDVDVASVLN
eukprot:CAMPEP_0115198738 /NCGR_PEP_ID=MMETSP0270-20121206/16258_1 /TAXON_ID=71861 /ORGANISM="Scrippsiella trochoidea, Strain CCMP3099" /LENGTH=266 /DNA_ID=CAMNT_0002612115 /DNA_START=47 /DNA_END=847 /DNA_ORIENTATION=+